MTDLSQQTTALMTALTSLHKDLICLNYIVLGGITAILIMLLVIAFRCRKN